MTRDPVGREASLERIVPDALVAGETTGADTLQLHLDRYAFARRSLEGGRVLDLACGVGYGSQLLAEHPDVTSVTGVDIDPAAVAVARARYPHEKVVHVVSDGSSWGEAATFDAAVSLETIEHVERPQAFLAHLVSLVRPGGLLIASVPVTPSVDANPHHRTDFTARSFRAMAARLDLRETGSFTQTQPWSPIAVLQRSEQRTQHRRTGLIGWYLRHPDALRRRIASTLRHGFVNHYLTVVWRRPG